jgi:hypothetical protein
MIRKCCLRADEARLGLRVQTWEEWLAAPYAREHAVSLNTVYTHLRRITDATAWPS